MSGDRVSPEGREEVRQGSEARVVNTGNTKVIGVRNVALLPGIQHNWT